MSEQGRAEPTNGVVTSDAVQAQRRDASRWRRAGLVVGVLALFIVGGVAYLREIRAPHPNAPGSQTRTVQDLNSVFIHPEQGIKDAQTELHNATTQHEKALVYADLGAAYFNDKQADQAIAAYQNAITTDSASKVAVLAQLASAYYANGQRDQAISTLQQLVQLLQQSPDPTMQQQAQQYQAAIASVEAGGGL